MHSFYYSRELTRLAPKQRCSSSSVNLPRQQLGAPAPFPLRPPGSATSLCRPECNRVAVWPKSACSSATRLIHVCALDLFHRKPRINSQLVAQQVAQQYPMPPPPKKERRERSERTDKERPIGEGERTNCDGRPEVECPERVRPEPDTPEKDKSDKELPIQDKPDREKDISPAVTKKPSSKKTRSVCACRCFTCVSWRRL